MARMIYFSGTTQLSWVNSLPNKEFAEKFGNVSALRFDSFSKMIGGVDRHSKDWLPVTRKVELKSNPSLHKCGARCLNAKGHQCECSCRGRNHGAGR